MRQSPTLGSLRWCVCHPVQSLDDEEGTRRSPRPTATQERIETRFDAGAWSEDLADSYLALCRVDDAVRMISDATRSGHAELALRTGDPESALEQLRPLRASCLSALGRPPDEIQAQGEQGNTGE